MLSALALVVVLPPAPATEPSPEPVVVFEEQGSFATVFVVDEGPLRFLRFDSAYGDDQSVIDTRSSTRVPMEYIRLAAAAFAFDDDTGRALVIGLGGGSFPALLRRTKPEYVIDAVDVDPLVIDVAQRFFGVTADARLALFAEDGARFVRDPKRRDARYDVAFLDAYSGDGIPAHLATAAFFKSVAARMTRRGVVVINIAIDDSRSELAVKRAFRSAFASCARIIGASQSNVVLIGGAVGIVDVTALPAGLRAFDAQQRLPFALASEVKSVSTCD